MKNQDSSAKMAAPHNGEVINRQESYQQAPAPSQKKAEGKKRNSPCTPYREKGKGKESKPGAFGTCLLAGAGARVTTDTEVPVTDSRFGLVVEADLTDGAEYTFAFDMLDAAGQPVTVTKAARFSAS